MEHATFVPLHQERGRQRIPAVNSASEEHRGEAPQNINATSERGPAELGRVIHSGRTQLPKIGDNSETLILFRPNIIKGNRDPKQGNGPREGPVKERQGSTMARVIEFYIPENYHPKQKPAVVSISRGKVIEFPAIPSKQSA
jgi:hypothetical protein